ncbi:MAG: ribose-phosphate diphosphokinase, partial [Actinomycetota bacterium]
MEFSERRHLLLYAGSSHPDLAEEVAKHLGVTLGDVDIHRFNNSEVYVRFLQSVRGADAFVLQTHTPPVNEHIIETLVMLDALKRGSARRITAVLPFFPYSRQDKKHLAREPISAKLMADLLHTAGADRAMSVDLHAGQIQGFFDMPFDHLTAHPLILDYITHELGKDVVITAPDAGRVGVADRFAKKLGQDLAIVHKRRDPKVHGEVETLHVVGDVEGRRCILVDDMIDSGGTIVKAAEALKKHGASEVYAACTHPVLSGEAIERLETSPLEKVMVTNSIPVPPGKG